jgi:hypothetical protein
MKRQRDRRILIFVCTGRALKANENEVVKVRQPRDRRVHRPPVVALVLDERAILMGRAHLLAARRAECGTV